MPFTPQSDRGTFRSREEIVMISTRLGTVLVVVGAVMVVVASLADPIGIGTGSSEFGWKQTVGVVVGAVAVVVGALVLVGGRRGNPGAEPDTA
jgi:NADH:ubiquinone oxidoreductase subunit 6 (subunit J)